MHKFCNKDNGIIRRHLNWCWAISSVPLSSRQCVIRPSKKMRNQPILWPPPSQPSFFVWIPYFEDDQQWQNCCKKNKVANIHGLSLRRVYLIGSCSVDNGKSHARQNKTDWLECWENQFKNSYLICVCICVGVFLCVCAGLHNPLQPCSRAARRWRKIEEMKRKWRENEEMRRKWRENEEMERDRLSICPHSLSISSPFLHFLILSPFPPSLSISYIRICHSLL